MKFDEHTVVLLVLRPDAPELAPHEADALQDAHLAHLAAMAAEGHLLAAGPCAADDERLRGITIWSVPPEQAVRLCQDDPAVRAGRLVAEPLRWWVPEGQVGFATVTVPRSVAEASD